MGFCLFRGDGPMGVTHGTEKCWQKLIKSWHSFDQIHSSVTPLLNKLKLCRITNFAIFLVISENDFMAAHCFRSDYILWAKDNHYCYCIVTVVIVITNERLAVAVDCKPLITTWYWRIKGFLNTLYKINGIYSTEIPFVKTKISNHVSASLPDIYRWKWYDD